MPDDDIEVIHMTALDWDAALTNSLDDLGLTWEQLTAQARDGDFESLKARQLWLMAGGQGPNQAEAELDAFKAAVRKCHPRDDSNPRGPWCPTCLTVWPCSTAAALAASEGPASAPGHLFGGGR